MLNLIIQTQYKENYAAHDEGYVHGVSEPYWKFKGGSSYLITDIDFLNTEYLQGLVDETAFLHTQKNEMAEEYVLDWELIDEKDVYNHIEKWESPYILEKNAEGNWTSKKVTENGDYGYMRKEILSRVQVWTYDADATSIGDVATYHVEYIMVDGTTIESEKALSEWLEINLKNEVA